MSSNNQNLALNRAKFYQIALFPFNNAATNCYFVLLSFITYYGGFYISGGFVGGILTAGAFTVLTVALSAVVMGMRIFDGITDPICGALMDRANGKWGKFRIFMIAGNVIMAVSILAMFFLIRPVPFQWLRWVLFIFFYAIFVLGYTAQCACTKAGQNAITNDPRQRSQFVIWNMVGMIGSIVLINMLGFGVLPQFVSKLPKLDDAGNPVYKLIDGELVQQFWDIQYNPMFYNILVPVIIVLSAFYTVLALIAIWKKDRPEFWGIDATAQKAKIEDYKDLLIKNSQIRWLVLSSGFNKLASTVATSGTIAILIYDLMMKNYNQLYIPIYALSFIFMGVFFFFGARTGGRKGQKRAVVQFTLLAFLFYIGIFVLILLWQPGNPATTLSLWPLNVFTVAWIILYGCGYGAYNSCSEMCIPMVADCTDYEVYRSGRFVSGIMGTIFSFADKIMSAASWLLLTVFTVGIIPALNGELPANGMVLSDFTGVKLSALICFCILPMTAWLITLFAMYFYKLNGEKLKEIQAVNAVRKAAIAGGMDREEAMRTWVSIDQVPPEFIPDEDKVKIVRNPNFMDKIYNAIWGKNEQVCKEASTNVVPIPEQYASGIEKVINAAKEAQA